MAESIYEYEIVMKEIDPVWGTSVHYFDNVKKAEQKRNEIIKQREIDNKFAIKIVIYDLKNDKVY